MPIFSGLYGLLAGTPAVASLLGRVAANSQDGPPIYNGQADKQPPVPFLVVHIVNAPPAGQTLDGISDLIDGELQFDSYASDSAMSRKLSRAVRDALKNFGGTLNDGTTIQFVEVVADIDGGYEVGGEGYLNRTILRLKAFYNEVGGSGPSGSGSLTRYNFTPAPDGVTVTFTAPLGISINALVVRNGMILTAGADYSYSGATVTFFVAPLVGDVLALYQ